MKSIVIAILSVIILAACEGKKQGHAEPEEDKEAKSDLQGIWVDADESSVVFRISGDTIYYPDSASVPVKFMIYKDTMVLQGANVSKYIITRRDHDSFDFKNYNGDIVKLVRSTNSYDSLQFVRRAEVSLNQRKVIKRDTVVARGDVKYHCYVQVNPTTYKVFKTSYNDEGLAVENIYYDNTIHISIFKSGVKIYSRDFAKKDFADKVPPEFLSQSILSDMNLKNVGDEGFCYTAELAVPDSYISFIVEVTVADNGKVSMQVRN
ncbi:DUF4738 domain-containing protein [Xylanibacter caecicola]|uniref:DUF4738 domain-containing protein n=1 Tax=Xylanibacter caecicola TaxID=2736294 RepID=UPI00258A7962|nr:DUF4738 domain-containing protein [Xylanibacter caecicola]